MNVDVLTFNDHQGTHFSGHRGFPKAQAVSICDREYIAPIKRDSATVTYACEEDVLVLSYRSATLRLSYELRYQILPRGCL